MPDARGIRIRKGAASLAAPFSFLVIRYQMPDEYRKSIKKEQPYGLLLSIYR
jgi:hypothetical protein